MPYRRIVPALLAVGAVLLVSAAPAGAAGNKTVKLYDNFFTPLEMKISKGSTVTWKWPLDPIDVHDVKLKKGPDGARKFHSEPASSGYTYKRRLKVKGTYRIICTLHEEMKMTIRVR